ncbi:MAG: 4-demethylwyosine synthase TYW1, partial [Candidatus Altiarchaeota archaeon]
HYKLVGNHSAVKLCHWTKKSLKDEGFCYKEQFYGIKCHRCLQFTPVVNWCNQNCIFCWRVTDSTENDELPFEGDDPESIIDEAERQQRRLLSGFGGIPERLNKEKFKEAQNPNQVAISLSGEPTLYPRLGELIEAFHKRGYTTYLVTNGTLPKKIRNLDPLPTQFYLSLDAPTKEIYQRLDNPYIKDGWKRINESLEIMKDLETRTVIRLTMVKGWNMVHSELYAALIKKAQPDFVEVKAYMFVGDSRQKMTHENMPNQEEIREFAEKLGKELGYTIKDEKKDSRVVLLSKNN